MDVFEAMGTARSMRWFSPDPVPDELLDKVLWAATRASSPNNTQCWDFVVVRNPEVRARIGAAIEPFAQVVASMPTPASEVDRRTLAGAHNLASNFGAIPVLIFVCGQNVYPPGRPRPEFMYSAVHAASQNLVIAARALDLGAAFTTIHATAEPAIREILGIPEDRTIGVTIPLGWPGRSFGPVARRPVDEVVHHDHW